MKWCWKCKRYFNRVTFSDHINEHKRTENSDAVNQSQYTGATKSSFWNKKTDENDYMICILHQKKVPCPVKDCHYEPFGMIRKSYLIKCSKGILIDYKNENNIKIVMKTYPFFPEYDQEGNLIPIDMVTRTVMLKGVPIKLRI